MPAHLPILGSAPGAIPLAVVLGLDNLTAAMPAYANRSAHRVGHEEVGRYHAVVDVPAYTREAIRYLVTRLGRWRGGSWWRRPAPATPPPSSTC